MDKGFNVKFIYRPNNFPTKIAIGLDDFAGTGLFTKEYVVTTTQINNLKFSLGLGWGKFVGESSFKNPLGKFSSELLNRAGSSSNYATGGKPSYDLWFRGESTFFGGLEYLIPNTQGLKLKIEYDPFDYFDFSGSNRPDTLFELRNKDKKYNIGLSYPINKYFSIDISQIKGNTVNLSFSSSVNFNKEIVSKTKIKHNITKTNKVTKSKQVFYEDLLKNLNEKQLFLQTASLNNDELDISISTSQHRNAIRSSSHSSKIAKKVADANLIEVNKINISHINAGVELNTISYLSSHLEDKDKSPIEVKKYYTKFNSGEPSGFKNDEFKPLLELPITFSKLSPAIISHVGVPEKFYSGTLALKYSNETQFTRNLLLTSELNYSIYSNITNTLSGPSSQMVHVRTDLVEYLKQDDFFLTRMQIDYIWSPKKDLYTKISGGIFETMYGGFGTEILYKPFNSQLSLGAEIFYVKQRDFDQKFKFRKYSTSTGHINIGYLLPLGIEANLSFGRYLAKDDGYTFDISRRTKSGFRAGVFLTRTNVSAEVFGEGSFDKGFYFQIPLDLFSGGYDGSYTTFKLRPLTRDGGAKLVHDKDLRGLIYNSSIYELRNQWDGFLN